MFDLGLSERKWKLAGIPYRYFSVNSSVLKPVTYNYSLFNTQYMVSNSLQDEFIKDLLKPETFKKPFVLGISSQPHDDCAMSVAAFITKFAIGHKIDCKFINTAVDHKEWMDTSDGMFDVLVLYNLAFNSTPEKLERTRDWLKKFNKKFCIVVVGGTNAVDFFHYSLCTYIDAGLHFNGIYINSEIF